MTETAGENNIPHKEPTPLSLEGAMEMDMGVKPPPAVRRTPINIRTHRLIKDIISTPKETGSLDNNDTSHGQNIKDGAGNTSSESDVIDAARARMNSEPPTPTTNPVALSSSGGGGDDPNMEGIDEADSKLYAEMLVEGLELLAIMGFQWWGKDPDEDKYKPNPDRKKKLIYLLSKILRRAGKKHPVELYFFATLILMYVPAFKAAKDNRKRVLEERAAQTLLDQEKSQRGENEKTSSKRKIRSLKQDSDISDATIETDN